MTAPSIKEALDQARDFVDMYARNYKQPLAIEVLSVIDAALATLSPPAGEGREAIAFKIYSHSNNPKLWDSPNSVLAKDNAYALADLLLASGLVQNEAGWREISTAPKDGTPFIGAFWSIRWADSHRKGDVVTCWWQPEFGAFISSCREMSLAPGLTFENGETRQLHSPVIEPVTHWKPLDRSAIRSARDGGAES